MKQITYYEVSTNHKYTSRKVLLLSTLSKDEAQSFARQYYADHEVICDIYENDRNPTDHTK